MDILGNLAFIKKLHPDRNKIVIITDDTPTGKANQKEIHRSAGVIENSDLEFDISANELKIKIQQLGDENVVSFTLFIRDKNNNFLGYDRGLKLICKNTAVPVYATQNFNSKSALPAVL